MSDAQPPIVLTISGHDPSGGAGIQADIESVAANGGTAVTAVTCLTVQDTRNISELVPLEPVFVERQARELLADMEIDAIKIGLIGNAEIAEAIGGILIDFPAIPVVLDPILAAGGGYEWATERLVEAIRLELIGRSSVITPNSPEARRLSGAADLDACAAWLLSRGCGAVLITGTHEEEEQVSNRLYSRDASKLFSWPRLPGSYHGSGCTLASAIAVQLARGRSLADAVRLGQEYTWQTLRHGYGPGRGQRLPNRFFAFREKGVRAE